MLGFHKITALEKSALEDLFAAVEILPISSMVIDQAVLLLLRQQKKMGLGDSIVAATAMVNQLTAQYQRFYLDYRLKILKSVQPSLRMIEYRS